MTLLGVCNASLFPETTWRFEAIIVEAEEWRSASNFLKKIEENDNVSEYSDGLVKGDTPNARQAAKSYQHQEWNRSLIQPFPAPLLAPAKVRYRKTLTDATRIFEKQMEGEPL